MGTPGPNYDFKIRRDNKKIKKFPWAPCLWVGRRLEPILKYISKISEKHSWTLKLGFFSLCCICGYLYALFYQLWSGNKKHEEILKNRKIRKPFPYAMHFIAEFSNYDTSYIYIYKGRIRDNFLDDYDKNVPRYMIRYYHVRKFTDISSNNILVTCIIIILFEL